MDRYNLSPFNIAGSDLSETPVIAMNCFEKVEATIQSRANIGVTMDGSEKMHLISNISSGSVENFELTEKINLDIYGLVKCDLETEFKELISTDTKANLNIYLDNEVVEDLKLDVHGSQDIKLDLVDFNTLINIDADVGKGVYIIPKSYFEDLKINTSSTILNEVITNIDVKLKPGEVLRINSDDFTAWVNDKNVLDKYKGEWIEVSRNTERLQISASNGAKLKGRLIYRERYL